MLDHGLDLALGGKVQPILYVEREAFAAANLAWQMEKGFLAKAPVWSDLKTLTSPGPRRYIREALGGRPLDIFMGGIPCQPYSVAGNQDGADDGRDLWPACVEAIGRFQPGIVFIENVPGFLTSKDGLRRVTTDLEGLGFEVTAGLFSSEETGASHLRKRVFVLAHSLTSSRRKRESLREKPWGSLLDSRSCALAHPGRMQSTEGHVKGRSGETEKTQFKKDNRPANIGIHVAHCKHTGSRAGGGSGNPKGISRERNENGQASEKRGELVANPQSHDRRCKQPERKTAGNGRCMPPGEFTSLANPSSKRLERRFFGWHSKGEWAVRQSYMDLPRYAPPRNDYRTWAEVARLDPTLMPAIESEICRMADGLAARPDQLRSIGNGVDPLVAAYAFITLWACLQRINGNL